MLGWRARIGSASGTKSGLRQPAAAIELAKHKPAAPSLQEIAHRAPRAQNVDGEAVFLAGAAHLRREVDGDVDPDVVELPEIFEAGEIAADVHRGDLGVAAGQRDHAMSLFQPQHEAATDETARPGDQHDRHVDVST